MAALSEVKDNNSTFDNSSNMEFHSEGEPKRTNVTLNQRWKSNNREISGGSGRFNDYIGEYHLEDLNQLMEEHGDAAAWGTRRISPICLSYESGVCFMPQYSTSN